MNRPPAPSTNPDLPLDPDVLIRLIDRLDAYPIGLPDSPEIREFLSIFLEPDEALLASRFPLHEATVQEMAARLGWDPDRTSRTLDTMADKGAVIEFELAGERYWLLTPSIIGFVEFSLMKTDQGLPLARMAELLDRYTENEMYREVFGSDTPMTRALVGPGIPVTSRVSTYTQVEEVVRAAGRGAFQICFCRHKQHLLQRTCTLASHEGTCISLGVASEIAVRRGFGRAATVDEILGVVRELRKKGLIQVTDNVRDNPSFICNCCGCCCGLLAGVKKKREQARHPERPQEIRGAVAPTPYTAAIDPARCTGCGACVRRCQVGAIAKPGETACVDEPTCLGCGACLLACKAGSLGLRDRTRAPHLPMNAFTKFVRISWEKGKLWPLLRSVFRPRVARLLTRS